MSIILYGKHTDRTTEVAFGKKGFMKVFRRGRIIRVVGPHREKFRIGSKLKLVRKINTGAGSGLGKIPFGGEGVVTDFDFNTKTERFLRVSFVGDRKGHTLSISPLEIEVSSY